jgi:peptidoglycan/LPS O-acetylase OafA/YrhL
MNRQPLGDSTRVRTPPPRGGRIRQIDVLKGLAILGVMAQHAFSSRALYDSWDTLHVGQAVPIFFVIMGLNAAGSMSRHRDAPLRRLYSWRYLVSRYRRLIVPLLWIWLLAAVVALAAGKFHIGPLVVLGLLPITSAPGNYFVTIVVEFALLFPLLFFCFVRAPVATTVAVAVIDVAFELAAPHIHALTPAGIAGGYLYEAAIPKYGLAIVAGMWLWRQPMEKRSVLVLAPLAAASVLYLVILHLDPEHFTWLVNSFSEGTNFLSVFYAVWLTCLGIWAIAPESRREAYRLLERFGRASYHIFLVQIVWFGVIADRSFVVGVAGIIASALLGHAYYTVVDGRAIRVPGRRPRADSSRTRAT